MSENITEPITYVPTSVARGAGDAAWMIPFFAIITSGIAFFFWQVAQYSLLAQ